MPCVFNSDSQTCWEHICDLVYPSHTAYQVVLKHNFDIKDKC